MSDASRQSEGDGVTAFEVYGIVQGVGFRWAAQQRARQLGLCGWIRNRADAAVEGEVSGSKDAVKEFLHWLATGPAGAVVDNVQHRSSESSCVSRKLPFEIRR